MSSGELPHRLDRTILIAARPATVFRFFTDTVRWAAWWGAGSEIDPRAGGRVLIRYPNGIEAAGHIIEIEAPERLVFTYGYVSGTPFPAGATRVRIELRAETGGTRLNLSHDFADPADRDDNIQGWRFQLSLFANVVADDMHAHVSGTLDTWFDAWSEPDGAARREMLASIAAEGVTVRDRYSAVAGLDDVSAHADAFHRFMPGLKMRRDGAPRQCQGAVLCRWRASTAAASDAARGTSHFVVDADGRVESVHGFWGQE